MLLHIECAKRIYRVPGHGGDRRSEAVSNCLIILTNDTIRPPHRHRFCSVRRTKARNGGTHQSLPPPGLGVAIMGAAGQVDKRAIDSPLISIAEASTQYGISARSLYRLLENGALTRF